MSFATSWKSISAAAIGVSALAGCSTASLVAHYEADSKENPIVDSCVWPGPEERASYLTARGELYQVTVYSYAPARADIIASISNGNVLVRAQFNGLSRELFNSYTGERLGLRLTAPLSVDRSASPPAEYDITGISRGYQFRAAATAAQIAFHVDRSQLSQKVCERKYWLGYGAFSRTIISPMFKF